MMAPPRPAAKSPRETLTEAFKEAVLSIAVNPAIHVPQLRDANLILNRQTTEEIFYKNVTFTMTRTDLLTSISHIPPVLQLQRVQKIQNVKINSDIVHAFTVLGNKAVRNDWGTNIGGVDYQDWMYHTPINQLTSLQHLWIDHEITIRADDVPRDIGKEYRYSKERGLELEDSVIKSMVQAFKIRQNLQEFIPQIMRQILGRFEAVMQVRLHFNFFYKDENNLDHAGNAKVAVSTVNNFSYTY
jgi:hypothetical protein